MTTMSLVIKTRGIAYLIVENNELLDWGIKRFKGNATSYRILDYLTMLISLGDVEILLINQIENESDTQGLRFEKTLRAHLQNSKINIYSVTSAILKKKFGKASRFEIAQILSREISHITHFLPKKKRVWESEDANMLLFDAAAQLKAHKLI